MTVGTTTLNAGSGGSQVLHDTVATVDGAAAPSSAVAQVIKLAYGGQGSARFVDDTYYGLPVKTQAPQFWRVGFAEVGSGLQGLAATKLTLIQTGSGMAVSQSGGNLVITTGTTTNAETVIRSQTTFKGGMLARYKAILSQRIANNTFRFELADLIGEALAYTINSATSVTVTFPSVNPFTAADVGKSLRMSVITGAAGIPGRYAIASVSGLTVTFTVAAWPASGSGTLTLYGHNWLANEYSGTTATNLLFDAQRRGWNSGSTTATINTTASPGHAAQIAFDVQSAGLSDALVASNAAYQWTARASRVENVPDDDVPLYLFIVAQNGSTAPASTTTLTIGFVQVETQSLQKVRFASADPTPIPLPTHIVGAGVALTVDTEMPTAAGLADAAGNPTSPTVGGAALAFNGTNWDRWRGNWIATMADTGAKTATFNGATQTNYNAAGAFITLVVSTVTGTSPTLTVQLQVSYDGTNFLNVGPATTALTAAGQVQILIYPTNASQSAGASPAALTSGATVFMALNMPLPRTWRLVYTIGGTTPSFTFTNAYAAYVL